MLLGGMMAFTDYSMRPAAFARALEERGFESVWAADHSHIPTSRKSPWPRGQELPKFYSELLDPFVALATASEATSRIKLGTAVLLLQQRDVIQTAKMVASLDALSGGRFLFGIGGGWNREEMEHHGTVFESRFKRLRESVEAMREIWTNDQAEYRGQFVNFDLIWAWPKPMQKPHPPIHVGGGFPHGARRAIRYGNGWIPIDQYSDLTQTVPQFREMARQAGRDPAELEISVIAFGDQADMVQRLTDLGVTRIIKGFTPAKPDDVLPVLDRWAT